MVTQPRNLGWKPGPADPRTLRLARYTTSALQPPPASASWVRKVRQWPMLRNDLIGNCVPVSCAHHVQDWTANACPTPALIAEEDVIAAYSAISGYDPKTGERDDGCYSLDALNYWRKTGIGGHQIVAYVQLDHTDINEVKTAIHLFGGVFSAVQMPRSALTQVQAGRAWTKASGPEGHRGSWGGHAMHLGGYGKTGLSFVTWGTVQRATWAWWDAYGAEAFGVVSTDWLDRVEGRSPLGFDMNHLLADLRRITD